MNNKKIKFTSWAFALGFVTLGLNAAERSSIRRALTPLRETLITGARPGATTEEMPATTTTAETTPMTTTTPEAETTSSELTTAADTSAAMRAKGLSGNPKLKALMEARRARTAY